MLLKCFFTKSRFIGALLGSGQYAACDRNGKVCDLVLHLFQHSFSGALGIFLCTVTDILRFFFSQ